MFILHLVYHTFEAEQIRLNKAEWNSHLDLVEILDIELVNKCYMVLLGSHGLD